MCCFSQKQKRLGVRYAENLVGIGSVPLLYDITRRGKTYGTIWPIILAKGKMAAFHARPPFKDSCKVPVNINVSRTGRLLRQDSSNNRPIADPEKVVIFGITFRMWTGYA
jgi:hypothetical protein